MIKIFTQTTPSRLALSSLFASLLYVSAGDAGMAQEKGYGQTLGTTSREREFYNNNIQEGNGGGDPASVPNILGGVLGLLNGAPAKTKPTSPDSAIDQALKNLNVPTTHGVPRSAPL